VSFGALPLRKLALLEFADATHRYTHLQTLTHTHEHTEHIGSTKITLSIPLCEHALLEFADAPDYEEE
jgi:hypothetical protein